MSEQVKTLWLLECLEGRYGRLFTFYAKDEQEAEALVQNYLTSHPMKGHLPFCYLLLPLSPENSP